MPSLDQLAQRIHRAEKMLQRIRQVKYMGPRKADFLWDGTSSYEKFLLFGSLHPGLLREIVENAPKGSSLKKGTILFLPHDVFQSVEESGQVSGASFDRLVALAKVRADRERGSLEAVVRGHANLVLALLAIEHPEIQPTIKSKLRELVPATEELRVAVQDPYDLPRR
jgi:hypothetical protein